jgi:hypothetical protein
MTAPAAQTPAATLADRVEALDGRHDIDSPAGAGTRVSAEIPVASSDRCR